MVEAELPARLLIQYDEARFEGDLDGAGFAQLCEELFQLLVIGGSLTDG